MNAAAAVLRSLHDLFAAFEPYWIKAEEATHHHGQRNETMKRAITALQQERTEIREALTSSRRDATEGCDRHVKTLATISRHEMSLRELETAIVKLGGDLDPPAETSTPATDQAGGRCVGEAQNRQATPSVGSVRLHTVPVAHREGSMSVQVREDTLVETLRMVGYTVVKVN